ncbi:MAG: thioredoxin family protein [Armatimonadota bacterium]
MTKVQVLGTGCPKCQQTADNAKAAAKALGLEVELVKVDKPADIARFGVMFTPALAVDGKVKVSGRVPTTDEIKAWLKA